MRTYIFHILVFLLTFHLLLEPGKALCAGNDQLGEISALLASGRYSEAASRGDHALKTSGVPEALRINIAIITAQAHIKAGNPDHAIKLLESIRAESKTFSEGMPRLLQVGALAALSKGDSAKAELYINESSALEALSLEDQTMNYYIRGMIAKQQGGKEAEADLQFKKAGDSAGLFKGSSLVPAIFLQRGNLAIHSGDVAKAIDLFKSSISSNTGLNPDDDNINVLMEAGWTLHLHTRNKEQKDYASNSGFARQAILRAAETARSNGNMRALSNALSKASAAAEADGDLDVALKLVIESIDCTQKGRLADLLPSRQHLAARILRKRGQKEASLAMYRAAAQNLELSKKGILPDCSTSTAQYQETVRPVYMELADLLIEGTESIGSRELQQKLLFEVRNTLEMLRTEELREYFGDACLGSGKMEVVKGNSPSGTALLYTVIFPDRMELLVSLPDGMKRFKVPASLGEIGREARMLRLTIERRFNSWEPSAKKMYDWIIRPLEKDLERQKITRLVFVPDGPLRNIPISVLHDGTSSVIDRFSVITLQNLAFSSRTQMPDKNSGILMAGISESVQGYPALVNVSRELEGIGASARTGNATLINSAFQLQNIKNRMEAAPFPYLHFATHGEFTGSSKDNYILTWDGKMTLDNLEKLIRSGEMKKTPIEILSLSACRTAAGDDRASLGLAGLAVKSGARNSIASLWDVEDKSTSDLFIEFYRILFSGKSGGNAESFRKAQLAMKEKYVHPYFWSPFLFIGAWF